MKYWISFKEKVDKNPFWKWINAKKLSNIEFIESEPMFDDCYLNCGRLQSSCHHLAASVSIVDSFHDAISAPPPHQTPWTLYYNAIVSFDCSTPYLIGFHRIASLLCTKKKTWPNKQWKRAILIGIIDLVTVDAPFTFSTLITLWFAKWLRASPFA